jgi:flavin-binding protein dodecin
MANHVYKVIEIVGSSETSVEEAISTAVAQASKTVRNMDWFEVWGLAYFEFEGFAL